MPAKRRCAATILVTSPPLPASTSSTTTNTTTTPTTPPSPTSPPTHLPATPQQTSKVGCPNPAQRIVGDCSFCGKSFCGGHRLPEHHGCSNLQQCRDAAHAANKAKLESERTVARKVAST